MSQYAGPSSVSSSVSSLGGGIRTDTSDWRRSALASLIMGDEAARSTLPAFSAFVAPVLALAFFSLVPLEVGGRAGFTERIGRELAAVITGARFLVVDAPGLASFRRRPLFVPGFPCTYRR